MAARRRTRRPFMGCKPIALAYHVGDTVGLEAGFTALGFGASATVQDVSSGEGSPYLLRWDDGYTRRVAAACISGKLGRADTADVPLRGRRPPALQRRYNRDGTVSLIGGGKVVLRHRDPKAMETFARGWYGAHPIEWGCSIFPKDRPAP